MSKFSDLNLSVKTLNALKGLGFDEATPIQSMAIPVLLDGKDIIGQAQTGTGKTFAYAVPAVEFLDGNDLQVLVLCPTRELAVQVSNEFKKVTESHKVVAVYGGQEISYQLRALKNGVQIVVGTPGRIMDHIRRKTLKLNNVKMVVIDEADNMLDMGFIDDIKTILNEVPAQRQTALFSATMPKPIIELTKRFQNNPQFVKVPAKELTVENTEQYYFVTREGDKNELLFRIFDMYNPQRTMVFCNTKKGVDDLVLALRENHYSADAIHGDLRQVQRDKVMAAFRSRDTKILVATDVAARGLDIENVEMVINYDLPSYDEYYVHRIGRTGRMGKKGLSFTFVVGRELFKLHEIEKYSKSPVTKLEIPSIEEVEKRSQSALIDQVKAELVAGNYKQYLRAADLLAQEFKVNEIIAALLKMNEKDFRKREFKAIEKVREQKDNFTKRTSYSSHRSSSDHHSNFQKSNKRYSKTSK
jgi:ATP-dependent RNA helicase DeaD